MAYYFKKLKGDFEHTYIAVFDHNYSNPVAIFHQGDIDSLIQESKRKLEKD